MIIRIIGVEIKYRKTVIEIISMSYTHITLTGCNYCRFFWEFEAIIRRLIRMIIVIYNVNRYYAYLMYRDQVLYHSNNCQVPKKNLSSHCSIIHYNFGRFGKAPICYQCYHYTLYTAHIVLNTKLYTYSLLLKYFDFNCLLEILIFNIV